MVISSFEKKYENFLVDDAGISDVDVAGINVVDDAGINNVDDAGIDNVAEDVVEKAGDVVGEDIIDGAVVEDIFVGDITDELRDVDVKVWKIILSF